MEKPTTKQIKLVNKIINHLGEERTIAYLSYFFTKVDINNLTKTQAQKLITGKQHILPTKPVYGVYGRDVY